MVDWVFKWISPHPHGATAPSGPWPPHYRGFTLTLRHNTLSRTPLAEWSARRGELYQKKNTTLTTNRHPCRRRVSNPQSQQASGRRPQTARPVGSAVNVYSSSSVYKEMTGWMLVCAALPFRRFLSRCFWTGISYKLHSFYLFYVFEVSHAATLKNPLSYRCWL